MASDVKLTLDEVSSEPETPESSPEAPSTEQEEVVEAAGSADDQPEKAGKGGRAQERIRGLVEEKKGLETKLTDLQKTLSQRDEEISKLVDLVEAKENDSRVVAKINELHETDPNLKPLIETLDKALRGEEVDLSKLGLSNKGTQDDKTERLIESIRKEMADKASDLQTELIMQKVHTLTDRYVEQLGEAYGEEDIRRIRTVLSQHIDWNAIEETPDTLNDKFHEGFQKAIDWYGKPMGSPSSEKPKDQEKPQIDTKQRLEVFKNQDWGAMKEVGKDQQGRAILKPAVSEDDFNKALAQALRASS